MRCNTPTPQHDVDQRPTRPPVSVIERMNGLELCVYECSLNQWRERVVIDRLIEIRQETVDVLWRWWYEIGTARIVVIATNPILQRADAPSDRWMRPTIEQFAVDADQVSLIESIGFRSSVDGELHRVDVREHLQGRRSRREMFDSALASARASSRTPTCIPSTFDEAMDSVLRRKRASGTKAGPPIALSFPSEDSASDMSPASRASRLRISDDSGSGRNAS